MRFTVVFVLLLLLEKAEFKGGRGGGGGGFKLFSFKKASSKVAKTKQKQISRVPAKATENDVNNGNKYFNRDVPFTQKDYGMIFSKGLSRNSYIYNNYYRTHSKTAGIAQFLTNALFFRAGMRIGRGMNNQYDEWNDEDDRRWRMTTKAPYFENKIPGEPHLSGFSFVHLITKAVESNEKISVWIRHFGEDSFWRIIVDGK